MIQSKEYSSHVIYYCESFTKSKFDSKIKNLLDTCFQK